MLHTEDEGIRILRNAGHYVFTQWHSHQTRFESSAILMSDLQISRGYLQFLSLPYFLTSLRVLFNSLMLCVRISVCIYVHTYAMSINACMHLCTHVYIYRYVCKYVCMCVYVVFTCVNVYKNVHTVSAWPRQLANSCG
jgi:hypothetical protein